VAGSLPPTRQNGRGSSARVFRRAVEGGGVQIYGDGSNLRDFVYVDDVVDAFLRAGATDAVNGQAFNVGSPDAISHRELVEMLLEEAGHGSVKFVEWPDEKRRIDIGSFVSDSSLFSKTTGWSRAATLREGLRKTLAYYRKNLAHYVVSGEPQ